MARVPCTYILKVISKHAITRIYTQQLLNGARQTTVFTICVMCIWAQTHVYNCYERTDSWIANNQGNIFEFELVSSQYYVAISCLLLFFGIVSAIASYKIRTSLYGDINMPQSKNIVITTHSKTHCYSSVYLIHYYLLYSVHHISFG